MAETEDPYPLIPLFNEFGPSGYQPYVLDLEAIGLGGGPIRQTLAFAVLIRQGGVLLALPDGALPRSVLFSGNVVGSQETFGPSTRVEVACSYLDEETLMISQDGLVGQVMEILLIDATADALPGLSPLTSVEELEQIFLFDGSEPTVVPSPDELVGKAQDWARGAEELPPERVQYYSADDVPETPPVPPEKRPGRRRAPGAGSGGDGPAKEPSRKKPTVSQLAESLQEISQTLPGITSKLQELTERTAAIEAMGGRPAERASALRRPLCSSAMTGLPSTSTPAQLVREMPPPSRSMPTSQQPKVSFADKDVEEIMNDLPQDSNVLALAVMEQSKALTALVSQIASGGDPLHDLSSSATGLSAKGSLGRAKLQNELAAHKGVFFQSVLQAMARRMQPAQACEVELSVLRDRGVTPSQYLERFGGFGKVRDLGHIIWQVALIMNFMQEGNHHAAMDATSLLFVCLEQAAMDGGNLQVGLLLSLTEDPPQSVFTGRSIANAAMPRPFAPTASQRWITIALQFLKEMDVISSRRAEVTSNRKGGNQQGGGESAASSNATPSTKKKPKGKSKGKPNTDHTAEEEA